MSMSIKVVPLAIAGFLLFGAIVTAQDKPRLAVLNFATRGSVEEADAIAEELRKTFVNSRKFTVIDRTQTEQILKEWETQQSGLTDDQKAIKIGKLYNVKVIVTGKLNKFASGGWQVSAVMLDAQTGITLKSETVRHEGKFFTLLDQKVPGLALVLAGGESYSKDPVTGMEFVRVSGGSFEMGCHANAGKCEIDEMPMRTVRLDEFWMGKYEVTQGQWKRVMGNNPSRFKRGDNFPVERVSWNDVQSFIKTLNDLSSATYRLPSEAEWEYACRAGGKAFTYGTRSGRLDSSSANYQSGGTVTVGTYPANSLGLYDMSGNVSEWVQDGYTGYGNVRLDNPIYEDSGTGRVFRGGSWDYSPNFLRCSHRLYTTPSFTMGFRLVRTN